MLYFSCNTSTGYKTKNVKPLHADIFHQKPGSSFSDTIQIDFPAAIFYSPDSLQYEKIKSVTNARIFDGSTHEYYYLMKNAHAVIKKNFPSIKIIEVKNMRFLVFIQENNSRDCVDLNMKNDAYGLLVFNRKKHPHLLDMANIETELEFYFSK